MENYLRNSKTKLGIEYSVATFWTTKESIIKETTIKILLKKIAEEIKKNSKIVEGYNAKGESVQQPRRCGHINRTEKKNHVSQVQKANLEEEIAVEIHRRAENKAEH